MHSRYRPWGPLGWLLDKLPDGQWDLLGTLSVEERGSAAMTVLAGRLGSASFLHIIDPEPSEPGALEERHTIRKAELMAIGADARQFRRSDLLADIDTIRDAVDAFVAGCSGQVLLDISAMPKRWFFPVIRFLLGSAEVSSLIVTYASAVDYGSQLSSDPAQLGPLPTFDGPRQSGKYDELIVGVGFAPLGLRDAYARDIGKVRYLFPFPPGPPNLFRNWAFLRSLEAELESRVEADIEPRNMPSQDRWQVHMYDVPSAFDALVRFTDGGGKSSALAPFGPKTLSLAMCLFALAAEQEGMEPVHVLYTQPRRYDLNYTTGIKVVGGKPDVTAYCLRIGGGDLYKIIR